MGQGDPSWSRVEGFSRDARLLEYLLHLPVVLVPPVPLRGGVGQPGPALLHQQHPLTELQLLRLVLVLDLYPSLPSLSFCPVFSLFFPFSLPPPSFHPLFTSLHS